MRVAVAGLSALLAGPLISIPPAQAQGQRLSVPAHRWMVEHGAYGCAMIRRIGGAQSPILMVRNFPGQKVPEITLLRDGSERLPDLPERIDIALGRDGPRETARVEGIGSGADRILKIEGVAEDFFERFAAADSLRLGDMTIGLPRMAPAIAAMRECHDTLLASWGVDVAARATYARQARMIDGSIGWQDYPREAVHARWEGRVVVRLAIDSGGDVESCDVVATSRVPVLDGTTCRIARTRFRFEPALDAAGAPIRATYVQYVNWALR